MRSLRIAIVAVVAAASMALPGAPVPPIGAAEHPYELETDATYDVQPESRRIAVTVDVRFTNTTPNPPGQFSVFDEVKLAVHDQAVDLVASDDQGDLTVTAAVESDVNVATVTLREPLRYEQTAELQLRYALPDSEDPQLRVRPSLVVFPAWSFGSSGAVRVIIPAEYDVNIDGNRLRSASGALVSGPIADPSQWLALVTAVAESEYVSSETTVPLSGGTADLEVRAFADDAAWGERTLGLVERALPLLEEEIGLPYPGVGHLVLSESVALSEGGMGETAAAAGGEILIAFDEPPFTTLHQVAHVWLSEEFIRSRWIREGMASEVAERIAARVEVSLPHDPAQVATERAEAAFPLDSWSADAGPAGEAFGYARSWTVVAEIRQRVGLETLQAVLRRVAAGIGPYHPGDVSPAPSTDEARTPPVPLTTRSFLDHLETVSAMDLTDIFRTHVLTDADVALLDSRAAARAAFNELVAAAEGLGAPDPVAGAMTAWSFEDAIAQMEVAGAWLVERDALLAELAAAGLTTPERLQQAYRAHGGGADAQAELNAEREVAEAYAATAADVNAERSFVQRVGLVGGPDPAQQLRVANGRFADGDLTGSLAAIGEAQQLLASADAAGIARLASGVVIALVALVVAAVLFQRRRPYTRRA